VAWRATSAEAAKKAQQAAADKAAQLQAQQRAQTRNDTQGYRDAGNTATNAMTDMATNFKSAPSAADVMSQPGYQFGLTQGMNNINNNAASTGGLYSGAQLKAAGQYGNDYATTKYDNAFNNLQTSQNNAFGRQSAIAGNGLNAVNITDNLGQQSANASSGYAFQNGNNQGAGDIGQANAIGGAINGVLGAYGSNIGATGGVNSPNTLSNMWNNRQSNINPSSGTSQNGSDIGGWSPNSPQMKAEGGPVRNRLMGYANGGMSRNALIQMMTGPPPPAPPPKQAPIPVGGVLNPKTILDMQEKAAGSDYASGGQVSGPGGPKTDSIPAMLSDGEHVMDAATVNAIGGGDNEKGQMKLNKLRAMLKASHV